VWHGQIHVFQAAPFIPESRAAIAQVGAFVRELTTEGLRKAA
jgi:hypothetical protein